MTDPLAARRKLLAAATPGPWEQHPVAGALVLRPGTPDRKPQTVADDLHLPDAALIAQMRADYEALLDIAAAAREVASALPSAPLDSPAGRLRVALARLPELQEPR